tara:strand:+ start:3939 stop:4328 length:390 start_codon:yes stop_codon:yes gene_type:complete
MSNRGTNNTPRGGGVRYNCYECNETFTTSSTKMTMKRPTCPRCRAIKIRSTNSENKLESLEDRVHSLEKLTSVNYEAVMYEVKDKLQEICKDVINEYTKAFDEKLMKIHGSVATINTRILKLKEEKKDE